MAEEFIIKKLECSPRGYRQFRFSGLACWGYDVDDMKVNIGPLKKLRQPYEFYSIDLNLNGVANITSSERLTFMIDFGDIRNCKFELIPKKRVRGTLTC